MSGKCDVIVVGAGPAGAMAANLLGRAGCRVLVLEQHRLPRYKPCAGGVPSGLFAALPAPCSGAIERRVTRVRFRFGREEACHELGGASVALVSRERFDHLFLGQAQATVHDGERVTGIDDSRGGVEVATSRGGRYHADYLIGADGAFSSVARLAGLRGKRAVGPALAAEVHVSADLLERYADACLFLLGIVRWGYAWLFPKSDHLSLGIGSLSESRGVLRARLLEVARQLGLPLEAVRPRGHGLPLYRHGEPLHRGRILLAGDAGGLMDPFSGEGIRHAVHSGRLAAEAILTGQVRQYTERVRREIGRHLQGAYLLGRVFHASQRLSFALGARSPVVVGGLLRMFGGELTYADLIRRVPGHLSRRLRWRR
ncbi:MAG: geranylgeranyl reductase family protein [Anaerolineae bacterium]|nr:geranylgeranyl reductase family protein [Anaerolineae bacterium]